MLLFTLLKLFTVSFVIWFRDVSMLMIRWELSSWFWVMTRSVAAIESNLFIYNSYFFINYPWDSFLLNFKLGFLFLKKFWKFRLCLFKIGENFGAWYLVLILKFSWLMLLNFYCCVLLLFLIFLTVHREILWLFRTECSLSLRRLWTWVFDIGFHSFA